MYIQTEETPNPSAIKFLPGCDISPQNPVHFGNIDDAKKSSNLAMKLFKIYGVVAVFFGSDFITITKEEEQDWGILKPEILITIMEHILTGSPIFHEEQILSQAAGDFSEIDQQIIKILNTSIRPAVALDGGDIEYVGFIEGIVKLRLRGACGGCPSASITLKDGIERTLQLYIPEVKAVEAVTGDFINNNFKY